MAETAVRRETVAVRTELADEELTCEVNGCSASVVGSLHPRQLPNSVGTDGRWQQVRGGMAEGLQVPRGWLRDPLSTFPQRKPNVPSSRCTT